MIKDLFHTFVYVPLYNGLVALLSIGPWFDLGLAVISLTIIVKFALLPFSLKAAHAQQVMRKLEAPMKEIREKYKDDKEMQGRKMLELYRENGTNPFSSFITLFVQLPVILGLYFVFLKAGFPSVNLDMLYSFVHAPVELNTTFLGFIDMLGRSAPLAVIAGISQYVHAHHAFPKTTPRNENATFQEDFARSMQLQMKYMLPVMIGFVAYWASAAVALYWITSNIFAIGQELYVKRRMRDTEVGGDVA